MTEKKVVTNNNDKTSTLRIRLYAYKGRTKEDNEFYYYKILERKTHKRVDCRFKRTVNNIPVEDCYIIVDKKMINKDVNRDFPCYWVGEIIATEPLEEITAKDVSEFFEEEVNENTNTKSDVDY